MSTHVPLLVLSVFQTELSVEGILLTGDAHGNQTFAIVISNPQASCGENHITHGESIASVFNDTRKDGNIPFVAQRLIADRPSSI